MKRSHVVLLSCLAVTGSAWLAHVVWGQAAETKEKTFTVTQSQLDKYVEDRIAKAMADHKVSDEQVLRPENWHTAIFNKAEYVIYTGPGQFQFHHWVETRKPGTNPATTPNSLPGSKTGTMAPKTGTMIAPAGPGTPAGSR
jgi:hypothetical protein